jgi:nitrogen fixation protein FixH
MASEASARFILIANPAQLNIELANHEGRPVQGGQIQIAAQWPGDPSFDFNSTLNEHSAGWYQGDIKFPRAGNWDLVIKVKQNDSEFEMEQKIFVAFSK